jgi:AcrR family transcriptional regulator
MASEALHNGPTRRDAVKRREALLDAAVECFEAQGYSAPLEDVAERAGVGRGTLYRNFKDREALVLAVFEREIDHLVQPEDLALPLEVALRKLVLRGARMSALFTRLAAEVPPDATQMEAYRRLGERAQRHLEPLVERAHRRAPAQGCGGGRAVSGDPHVGRPVQALQDPARP